MRILLLNQFIPPDASPTARLLEELREALEEAGHETVLIGIPDGYRKTGVRFRARFLRDLVTLGRLLFRGLTTSKADAVIAFSSPPCLVAIASLVARRHRAKLVHWCLDLYPDLVVALGVISENNPVQRVIRSITGRALRRCDLVVALDEDMADRFREAGISCKVLPPWPPPVGEKKPANLSQKSELPESPGFTWLYSGNLGRAHEWRTLLDAQKLVEDSSDNPVAIELVFQGGGAAREKARQHAKSLRLKSCIWRGYASDGDFLDSLLAADALIVTQRPQVRGMLWPSKLALALLLNRPLVWIGDPAGAIAEAIRNESPASCVAAPGEAEKIAVFLRERAEAGRAEAPSPPTVGDIKKAADAARARGLVQWIQWLDHLLA